MGHQNETVSYLHSKGSYHPVPDNDKVRRQLTKSVTSWKCLYMLPGCNTCGDRFSPMPHMHYGGNMWTARCSYIRKLVNPHSIANSMASSGLFEGSDLNNGWYGTGRYAQEHWIGSHPDIVPCDLNAKRFQWRVQESKNISLKYAPRFDLSFFYSDVIAQGGRALNYWQIQQKWKRIYGKLPGNQSWIHSYFAKLI